jgi:hypothetical protein
MEVKLQNVRICFAQGLFNARALDDGKKPKFSCQFIIPKADKAQIQKVEAAIKAVAKEKWAAKADAALASIKGTDFLCLRDGERFPDREELQDATFVAASNARRPMVIDRDKSPLTEADGKPYSGCFVNIKLDVYAYEMKEKNMTKKMVCATLLGVQFVKDGDAFTAAQVATEDDFDDLADTGEEDDLV